MTHGDGGKGDTQRPTDHNAYSSNYDLIWGKKVSKETANILNQQLQDAMAEDQEFERIQREQGEAR